MMSVMWTTGVGVSLPHRRVFKVNVMEGLVPETANADPVSVLMGYVVHQSAMLVASRVTKDLPGKQRASVLRFRRVSAVAMTARLASPLSVASMVLVMAQGPVDSIKRRPSVLRLPVLSVMR